MKKPVVRVPLAVGDDAFCLVVDRRAKSRSSSANKGTVLGAGRCRIVAIAGDVYTALVLATGKRESYLVGLERDFPRYDLYACVRAGLAGAELAAMQAEHNLFADTLTALWDRGERGDAARARVYGAAS